MTSLLSSVPQVFSVLLVVIVLQNFAAGSRKVFNVTNKVNDFIRKLERQHKTKVSWWDMYGKERYLVDRGDQYKKYQVMANADPMSYGPLANKTTVPRIVYQSIFHNEQPLHEQKVVINRTNRREKEVTWYATKSMHIGVDLQASVSLLGLFSMAGSADLRYDLRSGERHVVKEIEEFSITKEITIPPRSTVEVEWVISETIGRYPWKSDVVIDGWFALWFEKPVQRHNLWFHPIDAVRDPDLKLKDPSGVVFTSEGIAEGVTVITSELRVRQKDHVGSPNATDVLTTLNRASP